MSKKEKGLFLIFGCVLILLYLMSSTNLIIKEKKTEIYPISVIIEDSKDDYYLNYKKGMEQAAREYHVDTSFITLYESNVAGQQMDFLERELGDGAKALVISPVEVQKLLSFLEERKPAIPVLLLETSGFNNWTAANISIDYKEAGKKLGEAFAKKNQTDTPVYLFTEGLEYGSNESFYEGILSVLKPLGYQTILCEDLSGEFFHQMIESTMYPQKKPAAVIALDINSLCISAAIIDKSSVYETTVTGLYGIGCTTPVLNYLDKGIIRGLVVYNQFDAGYLSIQKAVEAINRGSSSEQVWLETFYIEKEDLRDKAYEKMLYPMG